MIFALKKIHFLMILPFSIPNYLHFYPKGLVQRDYVFLIATVLRTRGYLTMHAHDLCDLFAIEEFTQSLSSSFTHLAHTR